LGSRAAKAACSVDDAWIEALGRLNMVSSRRGLLSFVDPEIPWVGVTINFDYRNRKSSRRSSPVGRDKTRL